MTYLEQWSPGLVCEILELAALAVTHTYAVQHPDMSEPLLIDSEVERAPRALAAHASIYILRHYDVMLDIDDFTVTEVTQ